MHRILARGLDETAALWSDVRTAYAWVHRAAHILGNPEQHPVASVRREYRHLLGEMLAHRRDSAFLGEAVHQFVKVSQSYWSGLFCCYEMPDLPPTNNALEQCFGSARYHERRMTGRKGASPSTVVRGSVRLMAGVVTRQRPLAARQLAPKRLSDWHRLRAALQYRHETRRQQLRFRRHPEAILASIEERLLKPTLPT